MKKQKKMFARVLSFVFAVTTMLGSLAVAPAAEVYAAESSISTGLSIEETDSGLALKWESINGASSYDVYRAESRYSNYSKVTTVNGLAWTDTNPNADKYSNYYKIAVAGSSELSEPISLEIEMFGEGMYIFSPKDDIEQVYDAVHDIYLVQGDVTVDEAGNETTNAGQQFGSGRYALAFKTGDYSNMEANEFKMSYYMQILGLGKLPTDVKIKNVHVPPVLPSNNVTCNFWMGIENISIAPVGFDTNDAYFDFQWSVSQAAPARRLYVDRSMRLNYMWDGWASGGYLADSVVNGNLGSWSQQQYYIRNNNVKGDFYGINWNMVSQGTLGMNGTEWNNTVSKFPMYELESGLGQTNWESGGKYTVLDSTDAIREKPFLYFDEDVKEYKVFVPGMRTDAIGTSWSEYSMGVGESLDISEFYIARADRDNAASINAALDAGKNIILSPGIYYAEEPINIEKEDTVFLGLGLATIIPTNTEAAVKIADVDGVTLAGVILDADTYSENMLVVGHEGCNKEHSADPIMIQDVFIRVGGVHGGIASTEEAMVINSNDTIGDHFWIWRADHGDGVGWDLNTAKNGVVVNGDDVTLYGLMVEHFQEYDVLWRGENGKTYFLQNEKCYDPQSQDGWMSHEGTVRGYAAYKVANNVENHYAVGLGSYDVFINTNGASIFLDTAIEVPNKEGVKIENACTVEIANGEGPIVGIASIVNGTGAGITTGTGSGGGYARQALLSYCNGKALTLQDYYLTGGNEAGVVIEETGAQPTDDPKAETVIVKEDPSEEPSVEPPVYATGDYADWKNNAITYPAKGQLVAAGTYSVEFGKLDSAEKYEVYVDGACVKTIEGQDAKADNFSVDVYSVDVAKHTTYVVATLENGSQIYSNERTFFISKKGMGIWQSASDKIEELNLSWYYTWSPYELTGVSEEVEFVPMVWGDEADLRSSDRQKEWEWLRSGAIENYRYLLTFNEPDYPDQSSMTPERAVAMWPELEALSDSGTIVSSPAVAIPTVFYTDANNDYGTVGGWYGKYEELMAAAEYHDDFTAVHFYFDYPGDFVLDVLEQIHEATGKPIWITEWGVGQWTQVQDFDWTGGPDEGNWQRERITSFVADVLPKLDEIDYIERYAWFPFDGSNTEKFGNGAGGLFFSSEDDPLYGQLTSVGKMYKAFGNPEGYDANKTAQDVVLNDVIVENPPSSGGDDDKPGDDLGATINVVSGKTATASTVEGGNTAANAIDGNGGSRWESVHSAADPQWLQVDLGATYKMNAFKVVWETAAAKDYEIQVSADGSNWTTAHSVTDGVNGDIREASFDSVAEGRYVRVYCTTKTTGYGYSIYELEVYGVLADGSGNNGNDGNDGNDGNNGNDGNDGDNGNTGDGNTDLGATINVVSGKTATASSELGGNNAAAAIDGNAGSRWETIHSETAPQWLQVDLGETYKMNAFKIVWETAAAKDYEIQVSADGSNWTTAYTVTDGVNGDTREGNFSNVAEGRYVRVYCTTKTTGYGYSIYELEVMGTK